MTWNTLKPGEWKSEELSQGRIIDMRLLTCRWRGATPLCGPAAYHCEGCYTKDLVFQYRHSYTKELEEQIMADLAQPYVQGLTLLRWRAIPEYWNSLPLVKRIRKERLTKISGLGLATPGKK